MGAKQFGFGDYEQSTAKKRTKRERFLAEMEAVVPWKALVELIEPHYPKTTSKGAGLPTRWRRSPWLPRSGCYGSICCSSGMT